MNEQIVGNDELYHLINEKVLTVNATGIRKSRLDSRLISWWIEEGLIEDESEKGKWRKFSLMDVLWISTIGDLREFGLKITKIRSVKDYLFSEVKSDLLEKKKVRRLDEFAIRFLVEGTPMFLVVNNEGNTIGLTDSQLHLELQNGKLNNHIVIALHDAIRENFKGLKFDTNFNKSDTSLEEKELLDLVRSGKFINLKVRLHDGAILMIEGVESVRTEKRITEILQEGKFQNIEVKQENGKIVSLQRTVKKKF